MKRLIFDQSAPRGLRNLLTGFDISTASEMGWASISNGDLLTKAESGGFDVLVTADQNIPFQNNMTGRKLAIVSLDTNHWLSIQASPQLVQEACERASPGSYVRVQFPRQPRRKRSFRPPQP
jgi:hypothetical protein